MIGVSPIYLGHLGRVPVYFLPDVLLLLILVYLWSPPGPVYFLITLLAMLMSILMHELAHALVATARGMSGVTITLTGMGGFCSYRGSPGHAQKLMISIAGPLANFLFAAIAWTVLEYVPLPDPHLRFAVGITLMFNLFLGILNSLPIYPLDGGQALLALASLRLRPATARRLVLSTSVAAAIGAVLLWLHFTGGNFPLLIIVLFAFLLYQAFTDLR